MNSLLFNLSIIICTYNGKHRILPTLQALASQHVSNGRNIEIIIVDNNSTDDTSRFIIDAWSVIQSDIPLKVVFESKAGLAFARKRGVLESKGKYILF